MLAAEIETLSNEMVACVRIAFEEQNVWLENLLLKRREANELQFEGPSIEHAQRIVANLQGALLVARSLRSSEVFESTESVLVASYRANPPR